MKKISATKEFVDISKHSHKIFHFQFVTGKVAERTLVIQKHFKDMFWIFPMVKLFTANKLKGVETLKKYKAI